MLEYAEIPAKEAVTTLVNLCNNKVFFLILCGGKERALSLTVFFEDVAFSHSSRISQANGACDRQVFRASRMCILNLYAGKF